jgi:hypothetical protein
VIESRADVVNEIRANERDIGRKSGGEIEPPDFLLSLTPLGDRVGVRISERLNLSLEDIEVYLGPVQLEKVGRPISHATP